MTETSKHYLAAELETLFQTDPEMWGFIQHGSLDGIWYWDLENPECEWMSPEMWALLGVDPKTKKHDPAEWQDLIFQEDLEIALENFRKHCEDPTHPYDQIVRYRHADGSTVWVRCRGIAIRDASGKAIRMLGAHNDLTKVKAAEEDAKRALREAAAANDELSAFAYGISHDLKSPSNTVRMLLEELRNSDDSNLTQDQLELLGMAQSTMERMGGLVADLLNYTGLIGEEVKRERINLRNIAEDTRQSLHALITQTGASVRYADNLPCVFGSHAQIHALIQNLIENAIKYRHPERTPEIMISAIDKLDHNTTGFVIQDNGVGIPARYQDRIFDMFKRLHRNDEVPGIGMGLTLARRVVHNHGGDLKVSSEEGQGSSFKVILPHMGC